MTVVEISSSRLRLCSLLFPRTRGLQSWPDNDLWYSHIIIRHSHKIHWDTAYTRGDDEGGSGEWWLWWVEPSHWMKNWRRMGGEGGSHKCLNWQLTAETLLAGSVVAESGWLNGVRVHEETVRWDEWKEQGERWMTRLFPEWSFFSICRDFYQLTWIFIMYIKIDFWWFDYIVIKQYFWGGDIHEE